MTTTMMARRCSCSNTLALCLVTIVALLCSERGMGFSVPSRSTAVVANSQRAFRMLFCAPRTPIVAATTSRHPQKTASSISPLFQQSQSNTPSSINRGRRFLNKLRRAVAVFWTIALLWLGGAALSNRPSYASSAAAATTTTASEPIMSRVIPKGASFDKMVDQYVKDHMFDDDAYDPVESAYREAYDDVTIGAYPRALKEATTSILGQQVAKVESAGRGGLAGLLAKGSSLLQNLGLSAMVANSVMYVGTLLGLPFLALLTGLSYANAEKLRLRRLNKKRYGDDYSVDATSKVEEDVEAPDDDEWDDDEDDEDEDDEDDDEED